MSGNNASLRLSAVTTLHCSLSASAMYRQSNTPRRTCEESSLAFVAGIADQINCHVHGANPLPQILSHLVHFFGRTPHGIRVANAFEGFVRGVLEFSHQVCGDDCVDAQASIVRNGLLLVNWNPTVCPDGVHPWIRDEALTPPLPSCRSCSSCQTLE